MKNNNKMNNKIDQTNLAFPLGVLMLIKNEYNKTEIEECVNIILESTTRTNMIWTTLTENEINKIIFVLNNYLDEYGDYGEVNGGGLMNAIEFLTNKPYYNDDEN